MLKTIQTQMAAALAKRGIVAEVTFCRVDMVSVLVEGTEQFEAMKRVIAQVPTLAFDSEDRDPICGHIAFFKF
jgi:hypothetical protein